MGGNGTALVFLEGLLTLGNVYEKVKIFEIIELRKIRGNVDEPFNLKKFFCSKNIPDKFCSTKLRATFYSSLAKYLKTRR